MATSRRMPSQPASNPAGTPIRKLPTRIVRPAASTKLAHAPTTTNSAGLIVIPATSSRAAKVRSVPLTSRARSASPTAAPATLLRELPWAALSTGLSTACDGPYCATCPAILRPRRPDVDKPDATTTTAMTATTSAPTAASNGVEKRQGAEAGSGDGAVAWWWGDGTALGVGVGGTA